MSNSNTFQPYFNTFAKSDDLRRPDSKKSLNLFFTKVVVVCSAKLPTTFFKYVVAITLLFFSEVTVVLTSLL